MRLWVSWRKLRFAPVSSGRDGSRDSRRAGVSDRAILDATYVCVGFNIIARIADALGFKIPLKNCSLERQNC